ncbi:hypothetical protein QUB60_08460 [Microcoleus sp. A2-C5]
MPDRPNNFGWLGTLGALGLLNLLRKYRAASDRVKVRSDYH